MATANFSIAPDNTSDATFRAWIVAFFNAVDAILTHVAQTGEINTGTVLTPSAANQKRGFRMYRFNDSAHPTNPMYLRLDVGSGGTAAKPCIWARIGHAVDGSGNLAAPAGATLMTEQQLSLETNSVTAFDCQVSGDGSRLTFSLWTLLLAATSRPLALNVERTRDGNGNITDEATLYLGTSAIPNLQQLTITKAGNVYSNLDRNSGNTDCIKWPFPSTTTFTTLVYGLRFGLGALVYSDGYKSYNAPTGILIYQSGDYITNEPLTISVYGANKTYYPTNRGGSSLVSNDSVKRIAVRND